MIRTAYGIVLAMAVVASTVSCGDGGRETSDVSLAGQAMELVPTISAEGGAARIRMQEGDSSFDPTAVSAIPFLVFGSYQEVSEIVSDASVTFYNLEGSFSNTQAITDTIPTAADAAATTDVTWQGLSFHVVMGETVAATAGTVSPFDFGARSGSPDSAYEHLKISTISNEDLGYTANASGAWLFDSNVFYMLYAEDADNVSGEVTSDQKYVVQGSFGTESEDLIFNQSMRAIHEDEELEEATLVRAEVIGNVGTKEGTIRMIFRKDDYKVSLVTMGVIGEGDMIMKVKVVADGSDLADAVEKWICFDAIATIEDFQELGLGVDEDASSVDGRIQIASVPETFTGTCSTSEFLEAVSAEDFFEEAAIPNEAADYYSTLE